MKIRNRMAVLIGALLVVGALGATASVAQAGATVLSTGVNGTINVGGGG